MSETTPRKRQGFRKQTRQAVWDKTGGRCWYCGAQTLLENDELERWLAFVDSNREIWVAHEGVTVIPEHGEPYQITPAELAALGMRMSPHPDLMAIDHQIPWSEGGTHHLSNLVPACAPCNGRKGTKSLEAYRATEARRGLPHFTPEHIAYLEKLQIPLPPGFPCYPQITFWGENPSHPRPPEEG